MSGGGPPSTHFGIDAAFDSVAANEPAFAGSFVREDGRVVVQVARGSVANARSIALRVVPLKHVNPFGRGEPLLVSTAEPVIQEVEFTWRELISAKDRVAEVAEDLGVVSIDADERRNRVVVGISPRSDTAAARAGLRTAGIPDRILELRVREALQPMQQLLDRVRPLRGAQQIGPRGCTATIVASWNGTPVLLTNSHCTATAWAPDGGWTSQPRTFGTPFGSEVHDLLPYRCGRLFRTNCRRADLAAYSLDGLDVFLGEADFAVGQIYRTTERLQGLLGLAASRQIDLGNPPFSVEGTVERVPVGWVLERVGVTNGWQTGSVFTSCSDERMSGTSTIPTMWLVCQTGAHLNSDPGDSGSPVFALLANGNILFAGITWGGSPGGTNAYFSDVTQMRQEMAGLAFNP